MARVPLSVPARTISAAGTIKVLRGDAAQMYVFLRDTQTQATVYNSASGGAVLTQPIEPDVEGRYAVWLDPGNYDLSETAANANPEPFNAVDGAFGIPGVDSTGTLSSVAAINAYLTAHTGEISRLPEGRYKVDTGALLTPSHTHLLGDGFGKTVLVVDAALPLTASVIENPNAPTARVNGVAPALGRTDEDIRIEGITIEAAARNYPAYLSDPATGLAVDPVASVIRNPNFNSVGHCVRMRGVTDAYVDVEVIGHESIAVNMQGCLNPVVKGQYEECGKIDAASPAIQVGDFGGHRIITAATVASPAVLTIDAAMPAGTGDVGDTIWIQGVRGLGINEIQSVIATGGSAGDFTLTFEGQTTAAIAYNATAGAVQTALEALSNIAVGDVTCAGGPLPGTAVTCTFTGTLGSSNRTQMTVVDNITGGDAVVTTTRQGAVSAIPDGHYRIVTAPSTTTMTIATVAAYPTPLATDTANAFQFNGRACMGSDTWIPSEQGKAIDGVFRDLNRLAITTVATGMEISGNRTKNTGEGAFFVQRGKDVEIFSNEVDGTTVTDLVGRAVEAVRCANVNVHDNTFKNTGTEGVKFAGCVGGTERDNTIINPCTQSGAGGVHPYGPFAEGYLTAANAATYPNIDKLNANYKANTALGTSGVDEDGDGVGDTPTSLRAFVAVSNIKEFVSSNLNIGGRSIYVDDRNTALADHGIFFGKTTPAGNIFDITIGGGDWNRSGVVEADRIFKTADALRSEAEIHLLPTQGLQLPYPFIVARKTADTTINNDSTVNDDPHLLLPVAASQRLFVEGYLLFTGASATADFKITWSGPAGMTAAWSPYGTATAFGFNASAAGASPGAAEALTNQVALGAFAGTYWVAIAGLFTNSTTAGTLTFRWSQNTATVEDSTLKAGSFLRASEV